MSKHNFSDIFSQTFLILFIILTFLNCTSNNLNLSLKQKQQNGTMELNPNLSNCLMNYVVAYDTIERSWNQTPIYTINFYRESNDTLVYISGHKIRPIILDFPDNKGLKLSGYFFLKDSPVIIADNFENIGSYLYIKERLKFDIEKIDKGRDIYQFWGITLPTWIYRVENKTNLRLIRIEKGYILK